MISASCVSRWAGVLFATAFLGACSSTSNVGAAACPQVRLVDAASSLEQKRDGETVFIASIDNPVWTCEYFAESGRVDLLVDVDIFVQRVGADDSTIIPYFAAVTDGQQAVVSKRSFQPEVLFEEEGFDVIVSGGIELSLPFDTTSGISDHTVFIGLQLDREQFNQVRDSSEY